MSKLIAKTPQNTLLYWSSHLLRRSFSWNPFEYRVPTNCHQLWLDHNANIFIIFNFFFTPFDHHRYKSVSAELTSLRTPNIVMAHGIVGNNGKKHDVEHFLKCFSSSFRWQVKITSFKIHHRLDSQSTVPIIYGQLMSMPLQIASLIDGNAFSTQEHIVVSVHHFSTHMILPGWSLMTACLLPSWTIPSTEWVKTVNW